MKRNGIYYFKIILPLIFFGSILFYSIFQGKNIIIGPKIEIYSIKNGDTVLDRFLSIEGISRNSNFFSINNNQILLDKNGNFNHKLLLQDGYNIIIVEAKDKFGKEKKVELEIICKCSEENKFNN